MKLIVCPLHDIIKDDIPYHSRNPFFRIPPAFPSKSELDQLSCYLPTGELFARKHSGIRI